MSITIIYHKLSNISENKTTAWSNVFINKNCPEATPGF
jgi:hypothetical protein